MYLPVIYSLILTALLVMAVKHFQPKTDDATEQKKQSKMLFSTGFFLFIVLLIGFHLMGIGETKSVSQRGGNSNDYETTMLEQIHQPIHTGFPPF